MSTGFLLNNLREEFSKRSLIVRGFPPNTNQQVVNSIFQGQCRRIQQKDGTTWLILFHTPQRKFFTLWCSFYNTFPDIIMNPALWWFIAHLGKNLIILCPNFCFHHFLSNISIIIRTFAPKLHPFARIKKSRLSVLKTFTTSSMHNPKWKVYRNFALQTILRALDDNF